MVERRLRESRRAPRDGPARAAAGAAETGPALPGVSVASAPVSRPSWSAGSGSARAPIARIGTPAACRGEVANHAPRTRHKRATYATHLDDCWGRRRAEL